METGTLIRAPKELIEGFRNLGTSTIADVLDDLGIHGIIENIKPISPGFRLVGSAFTLKEVTGVWGTYSTEDLKIGYVIDSIQPDDVIVIDNGGHRVSSWGGMAAAAAQMKGVAGLIADGGVRDLDEITEFRFPIFSRFVVPTSGKKRIKLVSINTVVKIDNVQVRPGDILVGDGSGIVVIPIEKAKQIMETAILYDRQDKQALEEVRKGLSFAEAVRKFPKL
jgi:regulator of RNase E activity RraA